jgi:hypothetical protein
MTQCNDDDHKIIGEFLGLLVNLGMTPTEAYENVNSVLQKQGWSFVFFNDIEDFWVCDNAMK